MVKMILPSGFTDAKFFCLPAYKIGWANASSCFPPMRGCTDLVHQMAKGNRPAYMAPIFYSYWKEVWTTSSSQSSGHLDQHHTVGRFGDLCQPISPNSKQNTNPHQWSTSNALHSRTLINITDRHSAATTTWFGISNIPRKKISGASTPLRYISTFKFKRWGHRDFATCNNRSHN